jgi:glycerophosphoryl diester phosphodiesterase
MLSLLRQDGPLLRVAHRGAAALANENTLQAFRAAAAIGVDLIELDVLDLRRGPLIVAHSDDLREVSHGATSGTVRDKSLDALRALAPELPTLDEALAFFVEEAMAVGLHIDLKLRSRFDELIEAIEHHGLEGRTVISSPDIRSLRAVSRCSERVSLALTYPEDRVGLSRRPGVRPLVSVGLRGMRCVAPFRVPRVASRVGAGAIMLHHRLVSRPLVRRAHAGAIAVLAWTVDEPRDLARLEAIGVDGVITNDPRIFQVRILA